jgi:Amt family ammonium transporter
MGAVGKISIRALLLLLLSNRAAYALTSHAEKLKHENSMLVPIPIMTPSPILPPVNSGDTAWMLAASALVLMMTLPGLALFYGGLVQSKNVVSVMAQCLAIACVVSLLWIVCEYSLCFATGNPIIGDFSKAFFSGVGWTGRYKMIPETVYALFQLTFAIITPAIIVGGFAERMRFDAVLLFTALWSLIVYSPIAHAIWGGGWLQNMGFLDFAGGVVVHTSSSVSALVCAFVIGPRKESKEIDEPHNLSYVFIGGSLLWVGWFGFNAGSADSANSRAAMAALVTQLATASAAFAWMLTEWLYCGAPKVVGMCGGAVAGLVAITPASGYVGPTGSVVMGLVTGPLCYLATQAAKKIKFADDALDVFPVHGVGSCCGTLMTGIFASGSLGNFSGIGYAPGVTMMQQMGIQIAGLCFAYVWAPTATFCILKFVDRCVGLRISEEHEDDGLDKIEHLESGYMFG